jgi:hypothetical protein
MTSHERLFRSYCTYTILVAFLTWSIVAVVPPTAQAAELPLGTATGSKEAQITADGKQWITLPASSNPLYEGTMIRTGKGTASVILRDGTQLELQPRSLIGLSGSRTAPVVKIAVGQVLFRIPASSRAAFVTPTIRYRTEDGNMGDRPGIVKAQASTLAVTDPVGEITVNPQGGSRLGLQQGEMLANSVSDPGIHLVKAGQSVYIPLIGNRDPGFGIMLAQALPGEPSSIPVSAIPVFTADGKSIGYITADGSFVSSPGFTPSLPGPVPAGIIPQDATIPPGATPIFTAMPEYAGYILDDKLFAYVPPVGDGMAGAAGGAGTSMGGTGAVVGLGVTAAMVGLGVGLGVSRSGKVSPSTPE